MNSLSNNEKLIQSMIDSGFLKTSNIIEAFRSIDRADFIRKENLFEAYDDCPLPIGYNATISQPSTVAFMLEKLEPKKGDKILDIGSGSGWTTALLAYLIGEKGQVYGVELVPELVEFGQKNLKKYKFSAKGGSAFGKENAQILPAKKESIGLVKYEPYDKILVSASGKDLPQELVKQLKIGGRLIIPIRSSIWKIDKISKDKIRKEEFFGFTFVPLK